MVLSVAIATLANHLQYGILVENFSKNMRLTEEIEFDFVNYQIVGHEGEAKVTIDLMPGHYRFVLVQQVDPTQATSLSMQFSAGLQEV